MKIYHLNCGSMCPVCERLINGYGSFTKAGFFPCHCLLIESNNSLALVDTGFSRQDIAEPNTRLGRMFRRTMNAKLDLKETAYEQIKQLGFSPTDVTDIFPTHLDLDHAGGLIDFPQARVHIYQPELNAALNPNLKDKFRYRQVHFQHQPKWQIHHHPQQQWFGLDAFDCSSYFDAEIWMVPLTGHTLGHVGIAVKQYNKWLLHCGDAYFHRSQITDQLQMPKLLQLFEKNVQKDAKKRLESQRKLKVLKKSHPEIEMFCAHDPIEFSKFQTTLN